MGPGVGHDWLAVVVVTLTEGHAHVNRAGARIAVHVSGVKADLVGAALLVGASALAHEAEGAVTLDGSIGACVACMCV